MRSFTLASILLIASSALTSNTYAQDKTIDSLKNLLAQERNDSSSVNLLLHIGYDYKYRVYNMDSALAYYKTAYDLANLRHSQIQQMWAGQELSSLYNVLGNYPEALKICLANLNIEEQIHDTTYIFSTKREIMWVYKNIGDFKKELELAKQLDSFVNSGYFKDPKFIFWSNRAVHHNLGNIYENLDMLDSALHYRQIRYNEAKESKTAVDFGLATSGFASTYLKLNKLDSSLYYSKQCISYGIRLRKETWRQ